jgi:hypothetical protein
MIPTGVKEGWVQAAGSGVGAAIQQAATSTGVDFGYLLGQARIESGFNPNARARTSSATGLYQFIEQTWLSTVKQHGAKHGLGWAANAIHQGANGRFSVADPGMRRAILDMRRDPEAAASMAAEFASDNQDHLEGKLGRPVESVDLYLAHFLGAGGAARFLSAHQANPNARADTLLPASARANRGVFYSKDGSPRSFAEIRDRFAAKLGGSSPLPARTPTDGFTQVRLAALETPTEVTRPSPHYARLAYLMLAELGA